MQDPDVFLNDHGITFMCPVREGEPAVVDAEHRRFVNWEIFYFSSREAADGFALQPLQYCGILTDPVTKAGFRPHRRSPRLEYKGRPYYFSSDSTMAVFRSMPDSLAIPRFKMKKMKNEDDRS